MKLLIEKLFENIKDVLLDKKLLLSILVFFEVIAYNKHLLKFHRQSFRD